MNETIYQQKRKLYLEFLKPYLDMALKPAVISGSVPFRYYPEVDDYTMSMGMDITPGGRIWLGWFAGGDNEAAVIVLAKSDDMGKTFSKPQFILDAGYAPCGLHLSTVVGNLWSAPDGRLFLFFSLSLGYFDGRGGSWYAVCENPDAEKPVWSKPQRIWHGVSLNKPTVLKNGTWLLPISLWKYFAIKPELKLLTNQTDMGGLLFPELDPLRHIHVFASEDQGKTWQKRGSAQNPDIIFDEPMIAQRDDGSLLMYMRTLTGIAECTSSDDGKSWSEPQKHPTRSAHSRFFLQKLKSGRLLLVRNAAVENPAERSHMTAFLSEDDGKSWKYSLLLDSDNRVSYPDGFQTDDGTIYIQYDYLRQSGEIRMAVFREEDVIAGKNVSGKMALKHSVIQSYSMMQKNAAENV